MFSVRSKRQLLILGVLYIHDGVTSSPKGKTSLLSLAKAGSLIAFSWALVACFCIGDFCFVFGIPLFGSDTQETCRVEKQQTRQCIVGFWISQESQHLNPGSCVYTSGTMVQIKDELTEKYILRAKSQQIEDLGEAEGLKWFHPANVLFPTACAQHTEGAVAGANQEGHRPLNK